ANRAAIDRPVGRIAVPTNRSSMAHSPFAAKQSIALIRADAVPRHCRDSAVGRARALLVCCATRPRGEVLMCGPGINRRRNHVEGTRIISDKFGDKLGSGPSTERGMERQAQDVLVGLLCGHLK